VAENVQLIGLLVAAAACGAVAARLLITPAFVWWGARRLFRESKSLHEPYDVTWDERGTNLTATNWSTKTAWSDYLKYRDSKNYFLLYVNRACFHIIPKRAFSDDNSLEQFERAVRTNIRSKA
jgi:hypothetical protein